jgi:hypothetical protein
MRHVVLRPTASPRTSPGPRNPVPQATGRLQAQHGYARPLAVLRPMVSAWLLVGAQTHGQCSGPWSVRRPLVGAPASRRCSSLSSVPGSWSVLKPIASAGPMVGAPAPRQCSGSWSVLGPLPVPGHGRCSGPWSVPGPWSVFRLIVGAQAPGQCSGAWSVPSAWSVLRLMVGAHTENRGQAPSTTLDSAQQGRAADWEQAPLLRRSTCSQRLTPGVRHRATKEKNHEQTPQTKRRIPQSQEGAS